MDAIEVAVSKAKQRRQRKQAVKQTKKAKKMNHDAVNDIVEQFREAFVGVTNEEDFKMLSFALDSSIRKACQKHGLNGREDIRRVYAALWEHAKKMADTKKKSTVRPTRGKRTASISVIAGWFQKVIDWISGLFDDLGNAIDEFLNVAESEVTAGKNAQTDADPETAALIEEYLHLREEMNRLKQRQDELTEALRPKFAVADQKMIRVDGIVYKALGSRTSVSYSSMFKEALKKVNSQTRAVLEALKEAATQEVEVFNLRPVKDSTRRRAAVHASTDDVVKKGLAKTSRIIKREASMRRAAHTRRRKGGINDAHDLVPEEMLSELPAFADDTDTAYIHLFNPTGGGDWYIASYNPVDRIAYGIADLGLGSPEYGYFSIDELESITTPPFGLKIERDLYFTPKPLDAVMAELQSRYARRRRMARRIAKYHGGRRVTSRPVARRPVRRSVARRPVARRSVARRPVARRPVRRSVGTVRRVPTGFKADRRAQSVHKTVARRRTLRTPAKRVNRRSAHRTRRPMRRVAHRPVPKHDARWRVRHISR